MRPSSTPSFTSFAALMSGAGALFLLCSLLKANPLSPAGKAAVLAALTIGLWVTAAIPEHLTALLFFVLALLFAVAPPDVVFAGFSSASVWLVFGGLVIGAAINSTGLGSRIGRHAAVHLHGSYTKIISGTVAAAVLFSFLMPSSMGRVILLTPIALSVAEHFGFQNGANGRTGILLAVIVGTYVPAFGILTANVPNMVLAGMAETKFHWSVLYGSYLLLHFPFLTLAKAAVLAGLILHLFPDQAQEQGDAQLQPAAGPLSRGEIILAAALVLMLGFWITDFLHHISPAWIALAGAVFLMLPGVNIVSSAQFNQKMNWASLFFIAGILGVGGMITKSGLDRTFASGLISLLPVAQGRDFVNYMSVSLAASLTGVAVTLPTVPAVFTPLTESLAQATGLSFKALLMMQVTGFATLVFPYQGPPIVVGLQLSGEKVLHAAKLCVLLALITVFVLLPMNFFWWKLLDWL